MFSQGPGAPFPGDYHDQGTVPHYLMPPAAPPENNNTNGNNNMQHHNQQPPTVGPFTSFLNMDGKKSTLKKTSIVEENVWPGDEV